MIKALLRFWLNHIRDHVLLYVFTVIIFLFGSGAGAFIISTLGELQSQELVDYLDYFLSDLTGLNINFALVTQNAIINNLKFILLIWILGLTIVGIPITFLIIAFKGFIMGFTVGFLIIQKGLIGIILSIFSVLPQNLFYIPSFIICSVASVTFSLRLIGGKVSRGRMSFSQMFINYILLMFLLSIFVLIGGLFEGYVAPLLMKIIISYLNIINY